MRLNQIATRVLVVPFLLTVIFVPYQFGFAGELHPLGLNSLHEDIPNLNMAPILYSSQAGLPVSSDLTSQCPPVGDQGELGSCVAFAVGYAYKTYQEGLDWQWDVRVNSHIFSPAYIFSQIHLGFICDGGNATFSAAFNLLQNQGCTTLDDMPYDGNCYGWATQPNDRQRANALAHKSQNWSRLPSGNYNEIKAQLATGNPVVIGIPVYPDFDDLNPIIQPMIKSCDIISPKCCF